MRPRRIELMQDHVRVIYRSVTGDEPPEPSPAPEGTASFDEVTQRFAELETLARGVPAIAERVPPFSFAPPLDVIGTERDLVLELAIPGVEKTDVEVEATAELVTISGARALAPRSPDSRVYFHAEIARGPFRRVIQLPEPTSGPPRVEVENGIVRIKLAKASKSPMPRA